MMLNRRRRAVVAAAALVTMIVLPVGGTLSAVGLQGQIEALALAHHFEVTGSEHLRGDSERAGSGSLVAQLGELLDGYDHVVIWRQGFIERVNIIGPNADQGGPAPQAHAPSAVTLVEVPEVVAQGTEEGSGPGVAEDGARAVPNDTDRNSVDGNEAIVDPRSTGSEGDSPPLAQASVGYAVAPPAAARCDASLTGHFDVFLALDPPAAPGGEILVDVRQDFCAEFLTGHPIIFGDFNDLGGGHYLTDDPGWFMDPGNMLDRESLHYRALGALRFWDNSLKAWVDTVPNQEQVRIFGGTPLEVVLEALSSGDLSLLAPYENGTIWTTGGILGPAEAGVDFADSAGGIHTHLDFCLQDGTGNCADRVFGTPAPGAYLIRLQLTSPEVSGGSAKYLDSSPIVVALRHELSTADFQQALDALSEAPTASGSQPTLPAAGILILSGG